jgi:hypothetical protein
MAWSFKKVRRKRAQAQAARLSAEWCRRYSFRPTVELLEDRVLLANNLLVAFNSTQFFDQGFIAVGFTVQGMAQHFGVGLLPITLSLADGSDRQPEFESLCADALEALPDANISFLVKPTAATSALTNGGEIAYVYNHFGYFPYPFSYTSSYPLAEGAGAQLAIWELEYGLTNSSFTFIPGFSSFGSTQANFNAALVYADAIFKAAQGQNENAIYLDATLGGTVTKPAGQGLLSPTPTITTQAGGAVVVGSGVKLTDTATLSGGLNPTGSITFTLHGPDNTVVDTETVTVTGAGTYSTPKGFLPVAAGTYQWVASYSGNAFNLPVNSTVGSEPEVVAPASPLISTSPAGTVIIGSGARLIDSATLSGGFHPTGTITFTLTGPTGALVDTETVTVNGNGTYSTPTGYLPTSTGTFQWVAAYSGDANNSAVTSSFGSEPEVVAPGSSSKLELLFANYSAFARGALIADEGFVNGLYRTLLGRAPDAGGLTNFVLLMQAGVPRQQIAQIIWQSPEHRAVEVNQFYEELLGRPADPAGKSFFVNALLSGATEFDVMQAILNSAEYQASHVSNVSFLTGLYAQILGRSPDVAGEMAWLQLLENGLSRQQVVADFLTSTEAVQRFIEADYLQFLARPADNSGLAFWSNLFVNGQASLESIGEAIVASDEFFARF